jgi:hypothetical protein
MALAEGDRCMGNNINSSEHPRFSLFHRGPKTVKLPDGQRIPVVDTDINTFTNDLREREEGEQQRQNSPVQERKPLMGGLKRVLTGIVNGTIKS